METIKVEHCSKAFGDQQVLKDITIDFKPGVYYITGENGSGKSTLLKIMMGLILPDEGKVTLLGEDTLKLSNACKKKIGYVFASDRTLYYKLTAYENLCMIGSIYGMKKAVLKKTVPALLEKVGLANDNKFIESYSTGMKKRLMFARTMLYDPQVVFLDEPFSGLDPAGEALIASLIEEMENTGKTIVIVTHQTEYMKERWTHLTLSDGKLCIGL